MLLSLHPILLPNQCPNLLWMFRHSTYPVLYPVMMTRGAACSNSTHPPIRPNHPGGEGGLALMRRTGSVWRTGGANKAHGGRGVGANKARSGVGWRCTHKSVHTQGGAHTRLSVATAGILLFKGGCRGWPPCRAKRAEVINVCGKGRRCTHKAVHRQGGAHTRQSVATT